MLARTVFSLSQKQPKGCGWLQCESIFLPCSKIMTLTARQWISGVYIKQGGKTGLLVKNVFYRIFEKSSKIVFHLLQGQNKDFLRLVIFTGYNNI